MLVVIGPYPRFKIVGPLLVNSTLVRASSTQTGGAPNPIQDQFIDWDYKFLVESSRRGIVT